MKLKIKDYQLPSAILFNFEELKAEITERARVYETLVYTDDKIKEAKADKANLNKLKKALNDERIRREKEYMAPFKEFKAKVDEIIEIIDRPIGIIDKQVKEYEEAKKAAKKKEILAYMATFEMPHGIDLFKIFDPKWLNATVSMASVKAAIDERAAIIVNDLKHLETLGEYSDVATVDYFNNLDLRHAMDAVRTESEKREQMVRIKAEREKAAEAAEALKKAAENPPLPEDLPDPQPKPEAKPVEPLAQWVSFKCRLTVETARKLKDFFDANNIEFMRI